jgi:hypothetical protein
MRYLWWAEFQKRGALHYHALVIDPPFADTATARRWFDAHWRQADGSKLAGIQTWIDWRSAAWFRTKAGDYVLKDVRKLAGKHYEQDYERMPKGWRTFTSHQLTFEAKEHQEHESKAHTVCLAPPDVAWHERIREIWVYRVDLHVPARDGCYLHRRKRARRGASGNRGVPRTARGTGENLYKPETRKPPPPIKNTDGPVSRRGLRSGDGACLAPTTGSGPANRSTTSCMENPFARSLGGAVVAQQRETDTHTTEDRHMAHRRGPF